MAGNDSEEPGVCVTLAKVWFVTASQVFAIPYTQRAKNEADGIRLATNKGQRGSSIVVTPHKEVAALLKQGPSAAADRGEGEEVGPDGPSRARAPMARAAAMCVVPLEV